MIKLTNQSTARNDALNNAVEAAQNAHEAAEGGRPYPAQTWASVADAWSRVAVQMLYPEELPTGEVDDEDDERHDENTIKKVRDALFYILGGNINDNRLTDCINEMQNRGILFRERAWTADDSPVTDGESTQLKSWGNPDTVKTVYQSKGDSPVTDYEMELIQQFRDGEIEFVSKTWAEEARAATQHIRDMRDSEHYRCRAAMGEGEPEKMVGSLTGQVVAGATVQADTIQAMRAFLGYFMTKYSPDEADAVWSVLTNAEFIRYGKSTFSVYRTDFGVRLQIT